MVRLELPAVFVLSAQNFKIDLGKRALPFPFPVLILITSILMSRQEKSPPCHQRGGVSGALLGKSDVS